MHDRRLLIASAISIVLHAGLMGAPLLLGWLRSPPTPPKPPRIEALLLPAPEPSPLLKDTLQDTATPAPQPTTAPPVPAQTRPRLTTASAQRQLSAHVYYPPAAIAAGLEGEVRLLIVVDDAGRLLEVSVASSSGHEILDQAAVRAAYAMGTLQGASRRELILPVIFRLR